MNKEICWTIRDLFFSIELNVRSELQAQVEDSIMAAYTVSNASIDIAYHIKKHGSI